MSTTPLFDEAWVRRAGQAAERRRMEIRLGDATVRGVLDANMAAEVGSPLADEIHVALHHPERKLRQGFARMSVVAMSPPAWGVLARWAKGRAGRIRQGVSEGEKAEARRFARLAWRVSVELERLAAHPAYHGQAVAGIEPLILPAYRVLTASKVGDIEGPPAPTPDLAVKLAGWEPGEVEVGEMLPYAIDNGQGPMTVWLWHSTPAPTTHPE